MTGIPVKEDQISWSKVRDSYDLGHSVDFDSENQYIKPNSRCFEHCKIKHVRFDKTVAFSNQIISYSLRINSLNKNERIGLIKDYINGWKNNDYSLISSCLDADCIVIESHGPTYYGVNSVKLWFEYWLEADSKVVKWDIISYSFCQDENTAFIEWKFECVSNNRTYPLSGISVIKFSENKITHIHEYRMTKPAFDWDRTRLISD